MYAKEKNRGKWEIQAREKDQRKSFRVKPEGGEGVSYQVKVG